MSSLSLRNMQGEEVGKVDVPENLSDRTRGGQAVRDAIVAHRANQRIGSANTKTKGEVAGHGQKPWRQKGTGNARAGYKQSPIWRGGSVVFGPRPRSFRKDVNRKTLQVALARIVADRISENAVMVIDELSLPDAKTKGFAAWLAKIGVNRGLIVSDNVSRELQLASRNVPGVEVARASHVNVYQIARHPRLILTKGALEVLNCRVTGRKEAAQ